MINPFPTQFPPPNDRPESGVNPTADDRVPSPSIAPDPSLPAAAGPPGATPNSQPDSKANLGPDSPLESTAEAIEGPGIAAAAGIAGKETTAATAGRKIPEIPEISEISESLDPPASASPTAPSLFSTEASLSSALQPAIDPGEDAFSAFSSPSTGQPLGPIPAWVPKHEPEVSLLRPIPSFLTRSVSLANPLPTPDPSSLNAPLPLPPAPAPAVPRFPSPLWFPISLLINGVLLTWVILQSGWLRLPRPEARPAPVRNGADRFSLDQSSFDRFSLGQFTPDRHNTHTLNPDRSTPSATPPEASALATNPRHQLTYERWVALLAQEAQVAATQAPPHLHILAGDSISLWFPDHLFPQGITWLNQGISGETAGGLRQRLHLFDAVQADAIFIMIGINDLIQGADPATVAQEQQAIVRHLKAQHPASHIVVQSILPHGNQKASWEGRDRLLQLPNPEIYALNQTLEQIAAEEQVNFLDLWPLFSDNQGDLRSDLSTDGLHLNDRGYLVWSTALQLFRQGELDLPTP
ncbi:MAG: GDSL-type esterase/lipase family protein [Prochlorothrix sp.]